MSPELAAAYAYCQGIARGHYENFPVASLFLPRKLRRPVAVIYAFARTADDFSDEGDLAPEDRLRRLRDYGEELEMALEGRRAKDPIPLATAEIIRHHELPGQLFHDLLIAFRMDVEKQRYADFSQVLEYCRYSANPVGRLMLHLVGQTSPENLARSDVICSSLQLINFLQDIQQDYLELGRIYLPEDEMKDFGVTEDHIRNRVTDHSMRELFRYQIHRARRMMEAGSPLGRALPGAMGFEVRMITAGGLRVLELLDTQEKDVFIRPRLTLLDRFRLILQAF